MAKNLLQGDNSLMNIAELLGSAFLFLMRGEKGTQMDERGIYRADKWGREEGFKSASEIKYDALQKGIPIQETPLPQQRDFEWWQQEMIQRRDTRMEFEGRPRHIEVAIPTEIPIAVAMMGDQHLGGMYHDYELLGQHVELISEHPLIYVALGGDIVNGMFWNPGQDQELDSFWEQVAHARAMMDKMGPDKILWALEGDHDMWAGKNGITMYHDFLQRYRSHLLRGPSRVELLVGDQNYRIVTAHQFPGHSIYNKSHPAVRAGRELQGADVYVGYHTHDKGHSNQPVREFDGVKNQYFIMPGPYKYSDEYALKKGYAQQERDQLGAYWVIFHPHQKRIEVCSTAQECVDRLGAYM